MKHYTMKYPGDPVMLVLEMTREEFLFYCPRQNITIHDMSGVEPTQVIPMSTNEIYCDLCSSDPGEQVFALATRKYRIMRGYCTQCAKESWLPYCKELV